VIPTTLVLASVPELCWNAFPERTAGQGPPRSTDADPLSASTERRPVRRLSVRIPAMRAAMCGHELG